MNIYDIAEKANVSVATVSRALNNPSIVSPDTLARVNSVIEKYHFAPSAIAQGLVKNSTKNVAILLSDVKNPHFSSAAYVLERQFFKWGYTTFLCNTGDELAGKMDYIRLLSGRKIDGLVLLGSVFDDTEIQHVIQCYLPDIPIIGSNFSFPGKNCYSVQVNHTIGLRLAVEHLMARGFTDISFVKANNSLNTNNKVRGFLQAMEAKKLPCDPEKQVLFTTQGPDGGRAFVDLLLARPDFAGHRRAFIFMDDFTAIGAVCQLRKRGIAVPGQVGIIGHDNSTYSIASEPQLTTIDTRIENMAIVIARTMNDAFQGESVGNSIDITPELIVREST